MKEAYFAEDPKFFNKKLRPKNLDEILKFLKEKFILNDDDKIILITSGGTKVPLEKIEIRNIDNFSTGKRGTLICEYFLKINKKVIFLHRKGSYIPFEYHLKDLAKMENLKVEENNIRFNLKKENERNILIDNLQNYKRYYNNLFLISYDTIFEYGFYLTEISNLLNQHMINKYQDIFLLKNIYHKLKKEQNINNLFLYEIFYSTNNILNDMLLFFMSIQNKTCSEIMKHQNKSNELYYKLLLFLNLRFDVYSNNQFFINIQPFFKYIFAILTNIIQMKEKYNIHQEVIQNIVHYIQMLITNFNSDLLHNKINDDKTINNNINNINNNDNINHCAGNKINNPHNQLSNSDTYILHNNNSLCNHYHLNNFSFNINKYINEEKGKNKKTNQHISEQFLFPTHIVIMCAAASDFYIPYDEMHENKIDSNYSPLSIQLCLTPKFYKIINSHFPLLKYCIFKLEDEEKILIDKSNQRIKYTDLLIANLLTQRYDYVYIFKKQFEYVLLKKSNTEQIENDICYEICKHFSIL
ncbi:phosphopantothenoylcysteine synthetase, putative [Plasmodium reichenowi]|uniref:Phosphopantothenoylcysteine synthetase, putative n=1 Tax=Plasmodium reichenowi TaxID=5854 RepID=A0A151LSF5_PLARE|nr:phosphopantothenoylcysteine synthetase, putative [Plasmodium reichenowi]KYO02102.1 phosphopantothenoylcysteine synthetase, putative [Plasmodium reichenowi]